MGARGKDPKTVALLRLKDWLEAGRRLKVRETARKLKVTRRTFQRYIADLADMGVALAYEELPNRERVYFVPFERKRLQLDIGEPQVVALNVALGWLDQFEGNVLYESLSSLRERISRWLEERTEAEGQRWFSQKFFALPFLPYRYRSEGDAFNDVVTALLQQRKLEFGYRSMSGPGRTRPRRHKVRPYTLVFYRGAFHLLAVREAVADWGDPTPFNLARMTSTRVLRAEPYDYPEDWEPAQAFHRMTGMLPGALESVEAHFDPKFYDYLKKERAWPRGTKIVAAKKHVRFVAKLALNDELLNWFLGFGPDVKIIGPDWFRDRLANKARQTAARYA
jgi:predicted DNA-binding transcriptional regulator YafY